MLRRSLFMNSLMPRGELTVTTSSSSCLAPKQARKSAHWLASRLVCRMRKCASCPTKEQKVVITVKEQKCCSKALKIVSDVPGLQLVAFEGQDKNQIVLIGDGIDVMRLMTLLKKKVGCSELVSVSPVDYESHDAVHIPVGGYYSNSPCAYGPGYGNETNNQNPYAYGPAYGSGYGYETRNQNPYAYGPGHGYETKNQNLHAYGPGHGNETTNQNLHVFGPGHEYETRNQNLDSCCSIM